MCNVATASFDTRVNETVAENSSQIEFNLTDNNLVEMDNMLNFTFQNTGFPDWTDDYAKYL